MLTSLHKLTIPVISTALFLPAFCMPSSAQASPELALRPTRAIEQITPQAAAQVVSTANYQVALPLKCYGAMTCEGDLPVVRQRRRLNLTRISCWMMTATYSKFALGQVDLRQGTTSLKLVSVLPADHTTDYGYHSLNRAVDIHIPAAHHVRILLSVASGGQANAAACTAHGTLETLK